MKPAAELCGLHHASHEISFHQSRRKEVFPTGLPVSRIIGVLSKICAAAFGNQRRQFSVASCLRVIQRKSQPKNRVGMYAGANWIVLLGKKREVLIDQR